MPRIAAQFAASLLPWRTVTVETMPEDYKGTYSDGQRDSVAFGVYIDRHTAGEKLVMAFAGSADYAHAAFRAAHSTARDTRRLI
jgi:hypothetical protein